MKRKYSRKTIEDLVKNIDKRINKKVEIIAIGGTALTLLNTKIYTGDVDLCYGNLYPPDEIAQIITDAIKEEGVDKIDLFKELEMSLLNIPDFAKRAIPIPELSSEHLSFKIMHPEDIILHKLYRQEPRDIVDVIRLLDSDKVNLRSLQKRFHEIVKNQDWDVRKEFIPKFESFIEEYAKSKK